MKRGVHRIRTTLLEALEYCGNRGREGVLFTCWSQNGRVYKLHQLLDVVQKWHP